MTETRLKHNHRKTQPKHHRNITKSRDGIIHTLIVDRTEVSEYIEYHNTETSLKLHRGRQY